ncbi:MAG: hypothetical protein ABIH74_03705 [Candidatus Omnitrophota bacterium]
MKHRWGIILGILIICVISGRAVSYSNNDIQYEKITRHNGECSLGILYKKTPEGMDITVSAVATGKGASYRKWKIANMRLDIADAKLKPAPDTSDNFYVTQESFFRYPAAIIFAAIGTQYKAPTVAAGSVADITGKIGMTAGLGLLTSQAKGEITGLKGIFRLDDAALSDFSAEGGILRVTIQNTDNHQKENVTVALKPACPEPSID